jgi:hypothetical protein
LFPNHLVIMCTFRYLHDILFRVQYANGWKALSDYQRKSFKTQIYDSQCFFKKHVMRIHRFAKLGLHFAKLCIERNSTLIIIEHKIQEEKFHIYPLANGEKKRRKKTFLLYKHKVYFSTLLRYLTRSFRSTRSFFCHYHGR